MKKQQTEKLTQIAERVPSGDKWRLLESDVIYTSLTETLEAYYQHQPENDKPQAFRLEPANGALFVSTTQEVVIPTEPPKKFNMYGDH